MLRELLDLPASSNASNDSRPNLRDLYPVLVALQTAHLSRLLAALEPFLGLGVGVTPSGDDLIAGGDAHVANACATRSNIMLSLGANQWLGKH